MKRKKNSGIVIGAVAVGLLVGLALGRLMVGERGVNGADRPYVTYDGGVITEREVLEMVGTQLEAHRASVFELKMQAATEALKRRLLDREATKQNRSPEELMSMVAQAEVAPVTDQEVETFLANNGVDAQRAPSAERETARKILRAQREMSRGEKLIENLMTNANVKFLIDK